MADLLLGLVVRPVQFGDGPVVQKRAAGANLLDGMGQFHTPDVLAQQCSQYVLRFADQQGAIGVVQCGMAERSDYVTDPVRAFATDHDQLD